MNFLKEEKFEIEWRCQKVNCHIMNSCICLSEIVLANISSIRVKFEKEGCIFEGSYYENRTEDDYEIIRERLVKKGIESLEEVIGRVACGEFEKMKREQLEEVEKRMKKEIREEEYRAGIAKFIVGQFKL